MIVACGIWCLVDVSGVSPSSEQTAVDCSAVDLCRPDQLEASSAPTKD